jgi:hypothetical protein
MGAAFPQHFDPNIIQTRNSDHLGCHPHALSIDTAPPYTSEPIKRWQL